MTTRASAPPPVAPFYTKRMRLWLLHSQLVNERQSFISHWQAINRVLFPRRGRFSLTDRNRGDRRNKDIIDSTATFAARTLAAGMMGGNTSAAREWFELAPANDALADSESVKVWLNDVTETIRAILLKSNFYDAKHQQYGDAAVYGTSPMLVDEDDEDVIRCYTFPVGSYTLGNDAKNRVRVFTREFSMTVRQLVTKFGFENCSSVVQNSWTLGTTEAWYDVVHVIYENESYDATALGHEYKRYASCYFERGANERGTPTEGPDKFLSESGYDEWPLLVSRWDVTAEDVYGTDCPGMTALGDVLQLQFGEKKAMQAIEKHVNPPLVAPTSMRQEVITQLPGGVSYDDNEATKGLRPLQQIKPDIGGLQQMQDRIRARINTAFFADVFQMISYLDEMGSRQPITATEVNERHEEKMLVLGPVLSREDKDVLGPLVNRVFMIALRRGLLPPAPPELHGQELRVEYVSIMHAAQKAGGMAQMERLATFASGLAAGAQDPSVLDKLDMDSMIAEYHDMSGAPPRAIRSEDQVQAIRAQRQQAQADAIKTQQLVASAKGAKDLSQADTSGKNALTDLLQRTGAGQ